MDYPDDVIKWKHCPRYWLFVRGIPPHKGQWRGALMFSLICARINDWVNNREAGDLRRYRSHYDVSVMWIQIWVVKIPFVFNEVIDLHMPRQLSCRNMCKSMTWFNHYYSQYNHHLTSSDYEFTDHWWNGSPITNHRAPTGTRQLWNRSSVTWKLGACPYTIHQSMNLSIP